MRGTLLFGVAIGFAAILLAWCARSPQLGRAPTAATAGPPAGGVRDLEILRARELVVPVAGLGPEDLRDSFTEPRADHRHEAIDILATRGTRVLAADDGTIVRLATGGSGGRTIFQVDPTGTYGYYYAHLDGYAPGLREGRAVRRGQTLGYVGSSGNAAPQAPHLHFAVSRVGSDGRTGHGRPINPYRLWVRAE